MQNINHSDRIVVVTGVQRCGASLIMHMLDAGEFPVIANDFLTYESRLAAGLPKEKQWLGSARGQAVKILDILNARPPAAYAFDFILVERDPKQNARSVIKTMAASRQISPKEELDEALSERIKGNLAARHQEILSYLKRYNGCRILPVSFDETLNDPKKTAADINAFLGGNLNESGMANAVIPRPPECLPYMLDQRVRERVRETQSAMAEIVNRRQSDLKALCYDTDREQFDPANSFEILNARQIFEDKEDTASLKALGALVIAELVRRQKAKEPKHSL